VNWLEEVSKSKKGIERLQWEHGEQLFRKGWDWPDMFFLLSPYVAERPEDLPALPTMIMDGWKIEGITYWRIKLVRGEEVIVLEKGVGFYRGNLAQEKEKELLAREEPDPPTWDEYIPK